MSPSAAVPVCRAVARRLRVGSRGCASALFIAALWSTPAAAEVYRVGPGRQFTDPAQVAARLLPGDLVLIDGAATYPGGIVFDQPGASDRKIIIRGVEVNGERPVFSGGRNTIEAAANHYVFENLELTQGSYRCFFHHAADVTLRGSVVHDCPGHGLLGADEGSGTLLLEYTEFYRCGNGDQQHTIYMATDETRYPGSVFRMQHCYVHDSRGGHSVKSRAERNEIYFNWVEGGRYHELELIGADGQAPGLAREDSDLVGYVLRKTNDSYSIRIGGDGTGDSGGRYRFVNNTFLLQAQARPVFRLFDRVQSLEQHNNLFWREGGGPITLIQAERVSWTEGRPLITGLNNWVPRGSKIPPQWSGTLQGQDPMLISLATFDLRPAPHSPLVDAAASVLAGPRGFTIPKPLTALSSSPPPRRGGVSYLRERDGAVDIGAYEGGFALRAMRVLPERQPSAEAAEPTQPDAVAATGAPPPAPVQPSGGRCGCRLAGDPTTGAGWALSLLAFAGLGLSRRRKLCWAAPLRQTAFFNNVASSSVW